MISLGHFVSGLMQALTVGRTMSDRTSLKVADEYLNHDLLRGFPIPRMTLKQVDLEIKFAVNSTTQLEAFLKEPEVSRNIINRFRDVLIGLPENDLFRAQFKSAGFRESEWQQNLQDILASIERILSGQITDRATLTRFLALAVENFLFKIHHSKPQAGLLNGLRRIFSTPETATGAAPEADSLSTWAAGQTTDILNMVIPAAVEEGVELHVLVGGAELESKKAELVQTAKISFGSADRKWIASGQSDTTGEKIYILDRH